MVTSSTTVEISELNGVDTRTRSPKPQLVVKSHWSSPGLVVIEYKGDVIVVDGDDLRIAVRNATKVSF